MSNFRNIHPDFKCNGKSFDFQNLHKLPEELVLLDDDNSAELKQFILDWTSVESSIKVQTSGTTGKPKLIEIKKQAMVDSAIATGLFFDLHPKDTALCCLPLKYIAGKMMFVRALVLGLHLDIVSPTSSPLEGNQKKYEFAAMVPFQVENSIKTCHQVHKLLIGGAQIHSKLSEQLLAHKINAYESYSMTETVTHIALKHIGDAFFTTLPGVQISQDERNCLVIEAPKLSPTAIVTNDIVQIKNEFQFVWLGRFDHVINSGGVKIFPERVEAKLELNLQRRFFIAAMPDEHFGEQVVLIIEGVEETLSEHIFDTLDRFEKPKRVFFLPSFVTTATGKIKRRETLQQLKKGLLD